MPKLGYYEMGTNNAVCDQCGRAFKSNQLKKRWDNAWTCTACWEPRHPQDFVKGIKDNQAPALDRPRAPMPQYYANFPSGISNYASVENDPTINFGNEIDIRIHLAATNWASVGTQILIGKSATSSFEFSIGMLAGILLFVTWMRPSGAVTSVTSTAFPAFTNGTAYWLRVTIMLGSVSAQAKINFYSSTNYDPSDRSGTWTQIGAEVSRASTGSIIPKTNAPLNLKSDPYNYGEADFVGKIYYAEVLSAINGPTVYTFNPSGTVSSTMVSSPNGIWRLYNGATMVEI